MALARNFQLLASLARLLSTHNVTACVLLAIIVSTVFLIERVERIDIRARHGTAERAVREVRENGSRAHGRLRALRS